MFSPEIYALYKNSLLILNLSLPYTLLPDFSINAFSGENSLLYNGFYLQMHWFDAKLNIHSIVKKSQIFLDDAVG